jgi:hypothetical protein
MIWSLSTRGPGLKKSFTSPSLRTLAPPHMHKFPRVNARDSKLGPIQPWDVTLANPSGGQFTPASAPIVLRRVKENKPRLGFIRPDTPEYEAYREELAAVAPAFGFFAAAPQPATGADARPTDPAEKAPLALVG